MKKLLMFLLSMCLILGFANSTLSAPYTGADIIIDGYNYSDIIDVDQAPGPNTIRPWFVDGTAIYTNWAYNDELNQYNWVEYTADLTIGNWNIGLNAINNGGNLPASYTAFEIEFSDGPSLGTNFYIPASDTEVNYGFMNIDIATAGTYTYRFAWLNDQWWDGDANIRINSAFFDNTATVPVPEPATMLLLGAGLLGLAGIRRKFIK